MTSATTSPARGAALLSAIESRAARTLRRWSADELDRFAQAVAQALTADALRWGADDPFVRLVDATSTRGAWQVVHAEDVEASRRSSAWTAVPDRGAWWHLDEPASRRIGRALFGVAGTGPEAQEGRRIADELAAELWAGQLQALAALAAGPGAASEELADDAARAQAWRRWSGAVLLALPWCGATLQLLFRAAHVERVLRSSGVRGDRPARPGAAPVVPVLRALAGHGTRLEIRLDSFEIDLGSLVSLNVGDVLPVRHALAGPVRVCASQVPLDGPPLCDGWLGRRDDCLAVELDRPARPSAPAEPLRAKSLS